MDCTDTACNGGIRNVELFEDTRTPLKTNTLPAGYHLFFENFVPDTNFKITLTYKT